MNTDNVCFIFKPTHACNLACTYCFAETMRDSNKQLMSLHEAFQIFDWIVRFCTEKGKNHVEILWHGGEPLYAGPSFMRKCCEYYTELFQKYKIEVTSRIQTNLLLVNEEYISIFKQYFDSQIGFSYDYHSDTRRFPNGMNAETLIWDKAIWCKEQGLSIGAICQITQENIDDIKGMYNQFKQADISFKINRIFPLLYSDNPSSAYITDEQYIKALCTLFDLWFFDSSPTIEIGVLFNYIRMLLTGDSVYCAFKENCGKVFYAVGPGGKFTPCDRFDDAEDCLGNIYENTPEDIYSKRQLYSLLPDSENECTNCEYNPICHGGCGYNRKTGWWKNECHVNKAVWKYIETALAKYGLTRYAFMGMTSEQLRQLFPKNSK